VPTTRTPGVRWWMLLFEDRNAFAPSPFARKSHAWCKANSRSFSSPVDHCLVSFAPPLVVVAMMPLPRARE